MTPEEQRIKKLKEDGWGNCTKPECGYFFKRTALDICPACKHPWREPVSYDQPPYEALGFE